MKIEIVFYLEDTLFQFAFDLDLIRKATTTFELVRCIVCSIRYSLLTSCTFIGSNMVVVVQSVIDYNRIASKAADTQRFINPYFIIGTRLNPVRWNQSDHSGKTL